MEAPPKSRYFGAIIKDLGPIVWRNIFSLVVIIIGGLSILLFVLGDKRDSLFLASVIIINIVVGIVQELRAKVALEKLQALNQVSYTRIANGNKQTIGLNQIRLGDVLQVSLGDQLPVDGQVIKTLGMDVNEALLTGESTNIAKKANDKVYAGSIVVAGSATIKVSKLLDDSFVGQMTASVKRYQRSLSPIQKSLLRFIEIMAVVLVIMAAIILWRDVWFGHEPLLDAVREIAALAATVIAEGLILTSTLLFSYGAIKMSRHKVLLQQINAAEGLGRIEYLAVDKTGTLTENLPSYESFLTYQKYKFTAAQLFGQYLSASGLTSSTAEALAQVFKPQDKFKTTNVEPFSSQRKYGSVRLESGGKEFTIMVGAPEVFYKKLNKKPLDWLKGQQAKLASTAKRSILLAVQEGSQVQLIGLAILSNPLKKGTVEIVKNLQARGIHIKVISGDAAETVKAIASQAGIHNQNIIDGSELTKLNRVEFRQAVAKHNLFARILPEQKQDIIKACQEAGFTAMVGDGANDALAIKQADLGVAMFSGSAATRQIADVVLLNNNFAALPAGIKLSDTIITTLELIATIFFIRIWIGLFVFAASLMGKFEYPISPRNITIMNLFIIGFPVLLWSFWPRSRTRHLSDKFLGRTLPFAIADALVISIGVATVFLAGRHVGLDTTHTKMMALWVFLLGGAFSLSLVPRVMAVEADKRQDLLLKLLAPVTALILLAASLLKPVAIFFDLTSLGLTGYTIVLACVAAIIILQYLLARLFVKYANSK